MSGPTNQSLRKIYIWEKLNITLIKWRLKDEEIHKTKNGNNG